MVNVPHDGNDRWTSLQILFGIVLFHGLEAVFIHWNLHFYFHSELAGEQQNRVNVELLVNCSHNPHGNQLLDDFRSILMKQLGSFTDSHAAADNDFFRGVVDFFTDRLIASATVVFTAPAAEITAFAVFKTFLTAVVVRSAAGCVFLGSSVAAAGEITAALTLWTAVSCTRSTLTLWTVASTRRTAALALRTAARRAALRTAAACAAL
ncbi:hypothetical protein D3C87_1456100 [compost metagenome]